MLARGARVTVTTRNPGDLAELGARVVAFERVGEFVREGVRVLHSIPPEGSAGVVEMLGEAPARVVYLSTTGVYGGALVVDEATAVDWGSERARVRLEEEARVRAGKWSSLVLRPAAIYGVGRGAQELVRRGAYAAGENFVSRIHVDDLAAHGEAALVSEVSGAYPVADEEPARTREVGEFCAALMGIPLVVGAESAGLRRTMGNRRVDGSAIRRLLGVELRYPSYRVGIPACLEASG